MARILLPRQEAASGASGMAVTRSSLGRIPSVLPNNRLRHDSHDADMLCSRLCGSISKTSPQFQVKVGLCCSRWPSTKLVDQLFQFPAVIWRLEFLDFYRRTGAEMALTVANAGAMHSVFRQNPSAEASYREPEFGSALKFRPRFSGPKAKMSIRDRMTHSSNEVSAQE